MPEIEFLDVGSNQNEQHDSTRGRERFSLQGDPLNEPDFEVVTDHFRAGESDGAENGAPSRGGQRESEDQESQRHAECYACPIGVAYGAARGVRPETTDRLANAIADLVEAAAGAIDMLSGESRRTRDRVRRVDIE
ncbi:MAG: hypothetical protein DCC49_00935 [Acidobacteria bacterium]|nr:MAG: hypothetical protein DCC49_00935 [Acidobacteriota bacterium]